MKKCRKQKPSRTRRHRESVAAKRKARAFYKMRNGDAALPPDDEAEALFPWRGSGVVMLVIVAAAVIGWIVEKLF